MTFEEWVENEFPHKNRPPHKEQFDMIENMLRKAWTGGMKEGWNVGYDAGFQGGLEGAVHVLNKSTGL